MEPNHRYCEHNKRNNTKVLQTPFLEQKKYTYIFDILQQERKTVLVLFKLIWEMNTVFSCFLVWNFFSPTFFLSELFSFKEIESVLKFKWNIILFWLFPRNKLRKFENHYMDFTFWNSELYLKIICYSKIFFLSVISWQCTSVLWTHQILYWNAQGNFLGQCSSGNLNEIKFIFKSRKKRELFLIQMIKKSVEKLELFQSRSNEMRSCSVDFCVEATMR